MALVSTSKTLDWRSAMGTNTSQSMPCFVIVPSLACPGECSYCFGPHEGPTMTAGILTSALDTIAGIVNQERRESRSEPNCRPRRIKVMFHGGEPLAAGHEFWRRALTGLESRFGRDRCEITVQSNLWLLDDEYCRLFVEHGVEIGTSLDGPESINDSQRGEGSFARVMEGIRRAQSWGLNVGCIATFTPASVPRWREVFDFFLAERIGFSIHPAVHTLGNGDSPYALSADEYAALLSDMLTAYLERRRDIRISSLDQMCQGVAFAEGKVCSFRDCLGMFLAFDPEGGVYPCQRLCGKAEWRLADVDQRPSLDSLLSSTVARRFVERQKKVREACAECRHLAYCKGGCAYNAWAGGDGVRDPHCETYRSMFDRIQTRLIEEMGSEENRRALSESGPSTDGSHPLLRRGPLTELARRGPHPSQVARTARRIVAAVELARGPDIPAVAARLVTMGIAHTQQSGEASLAALRQSLHPETRALNNLYLHLTFRCQLDCSHCYARADASGKQQPDMPVEDVARLIREAKEAGFRQVVLTGGEPLIHSHRNALLEMLVEARQWAAPMNLVLRTNLSMALSDEDLARIAAAVDQVVVSVDGDERTHDARRGKGSYAEVIRNLEAYAEQVKDPSRLVAGELSLACVMRAEDIQGNPGDAVRELGDRFDVRRLRFRPLLPLGRAHDWDEPPASEALGAHMGAIDMIEGGFRPVASCGLGQNLYVEPSGQSFPCYAYHRPHSLLGNVLDRGLRSVVESEGFRNLACHHVDTNPKCRSCEVRYLCGGACRAWGGEASQRDLDTPPPDCDGLRARADRLQRAALQYCRIDHRIGETYHV